MTIDEPQPRDEGFAIAVVALLLKRISDVVAEASLPSMPEGIMNRCCNRKLVRMRRRLAVASWFIRNVGGGLPVEHRFLFSAPKPSDIVARPGARWSNRCLGR